MENDYTNRDENGDDFVRRSDIVEKFMDRLPSISVGYLCKIADEIPPADVRPNVRGRWIPVGTDDMDEGMFRCSECGSEHFFPELLLKIPADNFCPNCGAYMRPDTTNN